MKNFNKKIFAVFLVIIALVMPSTPVFASEGVLNITVNNVPLLGSINLPVPYKFYINEGKTAGETLPGQDVKANSNFDGLDITRQAIVNAPAQGGKFDFDATFYMKQSEQVPLVGGTIFSKLVKPSQDQINNMPHTKASGVDSYVDLIARIDDRITVGPQIQAYLTSHTWRPIYVFDGNYNFLADVKSSYVDGQQDKNFTFPSNGAHTFIIRTVPIDKNFTNEQLDAPMKLGFNTPGNNNFTVSEQTANSLAEIRRNMTPEQLAEEKAILEKTEKLEAREISTLKQFNLYTDGNIAGQVKGRVTVPFFGTREAIAPVDDKVVPAGIAVTYENPKLTFIRNLASNDNEQVGPVVYVEYQKTASDDTLTNHSLPADPTNEARIFKGWSTDRDAKVPNFDPAAKVVADETYYAVWANKVSVEFDSAGGTQVPEITLEEGQTAAKPADPTREGYTFVGWTKDGQPFDFSTPIEENITLTATWAKENVKVVFDSNDDRNNTVLSEATIAKGSELGANNIPANPTREGYVFKGWSSAPDTSKEDALTLDGSQVINANTTYYAIWEQEKVSVTFDSVGGNVIPPQEIVKGGLATEPTAPTREGYTFVGWTKDGQPFDFSTPITQNIILEAKWAKEKTSVIFDANNGSEISIIGLAEVDKGSELGANNIPANPTREGYVFKGWSTNQNAGVNDAVTLTGSEIINDETTYYAVWQQEKITVTFDSAGGSQVDSQEIPKGETATQPVPPTRVGYVFSGWLKDGIAFDFSTVLNANTTLTAKWTEKTPETKEVTHKFKSSLANIPDLPKAVMDLLPAPKTTQVGQNVEPTQPAETTVNVTEGRWVFEGYVDERNTTVNDSYNRVVEETDNSITFTGRWNFYAKEVVAKHTFVPKQGSPELPPEITILVPQDKNLSYGDYLVPTTPLVNKMDVAGGKWVFEGYASHPERIETDEYTFVGTWAYTPTPPVVSEKLVITFDSGEGTFIPAQEINKGEKVNKPAVDPTREGYTFKAWMYEGVEFDFNTLLESNVTLVAAWEKNPEKPGTTDPEDTTDPNNPGKPDKPGTQDPNKPGTTNPSKPEDTTKPQTQGTLENKGKVELVKKPVLVDTGISGIAESSIAIVLLALVGLVALVIRRKEN